MILNDVLNNSLCVDLETTLDGKIFKIGAVYQEGTFERQGKFNLQTALAELDQFGAGSTYVLGHNLLGHDLPLLETVSPNLALLKKTGYRYPLPVATGIPGKSLSSFGQGLQTCSSVHQ
jgi:ATP-dependent DNA helicase RecQ